MNVIYKYPFQGRDSEHELDLPIRAKVLSVIEQRGEVCVYASFDDEYKQFQTEARGFRILCTGERFDDKPARYIGTVTVHSEVLHVFEMLEVE